MNAQIYNMGGSFWTIAYHAPPNLRQLTPYVPVYQISIINTIPILKRRPPFTDPAVPQPPPLTFTRSIIIPSDTTASQPAPIGGYKHIRRGERRRSVSVNFFIDIDDGIMDTIYISVGDIVAYTTSVLIWK